MAAQHTFEIQKQQVQEAINPECTSEKLFTMARIKEKVIVLSEGEDPICCGSTTGAIIEINVGVDDEKTGAAIVHLPILDIRGRTSQCSQNLSQISTSNDNEVSLEEIISAILRSDEEEQRNNSNVDGEASSTPLPPSNANSSRGTSSDRNEQQQERQPPPPPPLEIVQRRTGNHHRTRSHRDSSESFFAMIESEHFVRFMLCLIIVLLIVLLILIFS